MNCWYVIWYITECFECKARFYGYLLLLIAIVEVGITKIIAGKIDIQQNFILNKLLSDQNNASKNSNFAIDKYEAYVQNLGNPSVSTKKPQECTWSTKSKTSLTVLRT